MMNNEKISARQLGEQIMKNEYSMATGNFFSWLRQAILDPESASFIVGSVELYDGLTKKVYPVVVGKDLTDDEREFPAERILEVGINLLKDPMVGPEVAGHCATWDDGARKATPENGDGFVRTVVLDTSCQCSIAFECGRNYIYVTDFAAGEPSQDFVGDDDFVIEVSKGGMFSYPRVKPDEEFLARYFNLDDDEGAGEDDEA